MFNLLLMNAFAQAQEAAAPTAGTAPAPAWTNFVPFLFIIVVFYFLFIRPQSRRQKEHQKFLTALKRGDNVVTASGIYGKVEGLNEQFVTLEVSDGVNIRILRGQIATTVNEGAANV